MSKTESTASSRHIVPLGVIFIYNHISPTYARSRLRSRKK